MGAKAAAACLAPAMMLAMAASAHAHPHVWIEMRSDVVFDDQGLINAINQSWTFDDAYAEMALDGLDANGDGVYSDSELEPLTKENLESLKDYDYFTSVRFNGEAQALGAILESGQIYSGNKLQLHFQVALAKPLDPRAGDFLLKVYDPEFFIAFDFAKDDPVTAIGAMPAACGLDVGPVPTGEEVEQTQQMLASKGRDWKPEQAEDFGALFAQPVRIRCKA